MLKNPRRRHPIASKKPPRRMLEVESLEERQVLSAATMWDIGNGVYDLTQTFQLHSNPTAKQTVYLDFDGYTTGNVTGTTWDNLTSPAWDASGNGASFTDAEKQTIQKVWVRVAEDFAPFNIDVTTQDPGAEALRKSGTTDDRWGIRVVITPNDKPAPGSGGVAYIGSFNFSDLTPVYVFTSGEKAIAEAASHEVGHSLTLNHDGTATLGYYAGHGSGATSWGPIMGASYNPIVTQWSKGEYSGANNKEDDLAKITTGNGFTYKSDDYGSTQASAFTLLPQGAAVVSTTYGIVERNTDSDWFTFWSDAGTISLNVNPLNLGPNLAVRADLYNSAGTLVTTVNPAGALNAVVNFTLPSDGQYFLKVSGTGKGDPLTNGFSNYGSLGNYRITGNVQAYTGSGGGGTTNFAPIANSDTGTTSAGVPVAINVLANDSDPNGDPLGITGVSNVIGGSAVVSGGAVIFTPAVGFTGTASFTYAVSDGKGGTASAVATIGVNPANQGSYTNQTNVTISSSAVTTVTSSINLSGLSGKVQDVNVSLNLYHTWVSDLKITLIAPDGTRILLFNRAGGSGDNLLNTTFDDSAGVAIAGSAAPFTGTFRPTQLLSALNGKNPNGVWKLEVRDVYAADGGYLDNWTLTLRRTAAAKAVGQTSLASLPDLASGNGGATVSFAQSARVEAPVGTWSAKAKQDAVAARVNAIKSWLADFAGHSHQEPEMEGDLPMWVG